MTIFIDFSIDFLLNFQWRAKLKPLSIENVFFFSFGISFGINFSIGMVSANTEMAEILVSANILIWSFTTDKDSSFEAYIQSLNLEIQWKCKKIIIDWKPILVC